MMEYLSGLLFTLAKSLLLPVIGILLLLTCTTLMNVGGVLSEWLQRRKHHTRFASFIRKLKSDPGREFQAEDVPQGLGFVRDVLTYPIGSQEKTLDDFQLKCEQAVGKLQIGVRLGPMLGLVGTLIPLGPALVALSSGNLSALSQQLIVAFSTTVLGLMIGGICYFIATTRRAWYNRDLSDLTYLLSRLAKTN